jgi:hypothetical protein
MTAADATRSSGCGQVDGNGPRADQKVIAVGEADVYVVLRLAAACLLSIDGPAELATLMMEQLAARISALPFQTESVRAWRSLFRMWSETQRSIERGEG